MWKPLKPRRPRSHRVGYKETPVKCKACAKLLVRIRRLEKAMRYAIKESEIIDLGTKGPEWKKLERKSYRFGSDVLRDALSGRTR